MKRSKIVLFIAEMLIEPRSDDAMEQADFMLKQLEKKGMRPPVVYFVDKNPEWFGGEIYTEEWESE